MGADYIINIRDQADPVEEVKKLTGGRGADYVIEAVGEPETYEQALKLSSGHGKAFKICCRQHQGVEKDSKGCGKIIGRKK